MFIVHHGIKGQKWGVRRFQNEDGTSTQQGKTRYRSTSIGSWLARKQNEQVDKSFKQWREGSKKKETAIDAGKKRNEALIAYKTGSGDRKAYKQANKEYKKALKENTSYRKGSVREQVGRDLSRQYLTQAKRVEKQLKEDPTNKDLRKQYTKLMNAHDVERAKARRAQSVGQSRSSFKAGLKRTATRTVKAIAVSAAVGVGLSYANKMGYSIPVNSQDVLQYANQIRDMFRFVY